MLHRNANKISFYWSQISDCQWQFFFPLLIRQCKDITSKIVSNLLERFFLFLHLCVKICFQCFYGPAQNCIRYVVFCDRIATMQRRGYRHHPDAALYSWPTLTKVPTLCHRIRIPIPDILGRIFISLDKYR